MMVLADYSRFLSPTFICTESSFIIVALIAAYELLIGDYVTNAQQEETRQKAAVQTRGRGYDSFETSSNSSSNNTLSRLQQHPSRPSHRSLSPGGQRVRHESGRGASQQPQKLQPSGDGEASYLYPTHQSRSSSRPPGDSNRPGKSNGETSMAESPGDTRFASPGRGSDGDSTRRMFYMAILLALLSRFILLPVETYCLLLKDDVLILSPLSQILLRLSQTFPDIAFASALSTLIIFCAKIAFSAMPPLTPDLNTNEGSVHGGDDTETISLLGGERNPKLLTSIDISDRTGSSVITATKRKTQTAQHTCSSYIMRLSQTILASKTTFGTWNSILSVSYSFVFIADLASPHAPPIICEFWLTILITSVYTILLITLIYAATLLGRALCSGVVRRKIAFSLSLRLWGCCTLLALMFIDRIVSFSMAAAYSMSGTHQVKETRIHIGPIWNPINYAISESLPVLLLLFMMHRKRKEVQKDVFIMHTLYSLRNNLFGSSGRLSSAVVTSTSSDDAVAARRGVVNSEIRNSTSSDDAVAARRGDGMSGRQFHSHGGSRGDSFLPDQRNLRSNIQKDAHATMYHPK